MNLQLWAGTYGAVSWGVVGHRKVKAPGLTQPN